MGQGAKMRKPCAPWQFKKHVKALRGRGSPFQMILEAHTWARSISGGLCHIMHPSRPRMSSRTWARTRWPFSAAPTGWSDNAGHCVLCPPVQEGSCASTAQAGATR